MELWKTEENQLGSLLSPHRPLLRRVAARFGERVIGVLSNIIDGDHRRPDSQRDGHDDSGGQQQLFAQREIEHFRTG